MKRKIILSLIVMTTLLFLFTTFIYSDQYDFRKTNWGMSKEQVEATEDKESYAENDIMVAYRVEIDAKDFLCIYQFLEDKLFFSGYVFEGEHTNENDYIHDYKEIKEILIKKYGESDKKKLKFLYNREEIYWENDLFEKRESDWGMAVSIGHLSYSSIWETPTTRIELILDGDNYKISLRIRYTSKELEEWANKILEEEAKSNF